jgi:hypothetical protein
MDIVEIAIVGSTSQQYLLLLSKGMDYNKNLYMVENPRLVGLVVELVELQLRENWNYDEPVEKVMMRI